jgi:hypothetical protein
VLAHALFVFHTWYPKREIVAVADRAYASPKLLDRCRKLSEPITFVSRLRLDAALYEPAPPRRPGQLGRPRLKGERLPNLTELAQDPATVWKPTKKIANWYGSGDRTVEIASETAVWYSTGLFAVPIRGVLIRDPEGGFDPQVLLCTDLDADPERIVSWYVMRWQLEVSFKEARRHLGFETQRQCSEMDHTAHHTGAAIGFVLADRLVRPSVEEAGGGGGCLSAPGFLVPQEASHIRRCARVGAKGAVGECDFLRVVRRDRHDKSSEGLLGKPNRGDLLRGMNG